MKFNSKLIHAGWDSDADAEGAITVPIYRTTAYQFNNTEHAASLFALKEFGNIYSRIGNPTVGALEARLTALEDGATNLDVESAQLMADQIMEMAKMMNLESEHQYVQGHVEKIKGAVKGETNESIKLTGLVNEIEVADNTEFKVALKHLLQKHATNLKRGSDDTEFKLTLKHLLDKHVVKGGEKKEKAK